MPVEQAFIDWAEIERRSATRLEELSLEDDADVHHVSCQPAMEFRGRVGDWVADIRQARQRGDTVHFVADSAGRAERTVEILRDYEIVGGGCRRRSRGGGHDRRRHALSRVPTR